MAKRDATARMMANRTRFDEPTRIRYVERILAGEVSAAAVARELGISQPSVYQWVKRFKKKLPKSNRQQTLVSNGSPASGPMSVATNGELPPAPTVALNGLEEYVKALVDREVGRAMREWRRKMLEMG